MRVHMPYTFKTLSYASSFRRHTSGTIISPCNGVDYPRTHNVRTLLEILQRVISEDRIKDLTLVV